MRAIVDTHCHLDFKDFDADRDQVIDRARKAGVARVVNIGSSVAGSRRSVELAKQYECVYASIGVHPHEAASVTDAVISGLESLAKDNRKVVAIGEVGLDYYRNLSPKEAQVKAFERFIGLANNLELPMVIHSREAESDLLAILKGCGRRLKGVMHCFSGDGRFLSECLALGLHVSFTCNLTFKSAARLRETAARVPAERLLLETDAPFLAPQAQRGKRNEPANCAQLLDVWAGLLKLSADDVARITTHNANALFHLGIEEPSVVAYPIRDALYLNITNECTNACDFCVRKSTPFVKGHNLKLERIPSVDELRRALGEARGYREIVFCGYGEPTTRLETVLVLAREMKKNGMRTRLVTNGHGDIINGRPIAAELAGLIDKVSVSLNADTPEKYAELCKPKFGKDTYNRVVQFIKSCVARGIETEVTCLDADGVDIKRCEEIARGLGARFRLRSLGAVG